MTKRSPMVLHLIREWVETQDYFMTLSRGPVSNEIIDAWITAHPQKPFVFASEIIGNKRIVQLLCTRCADVHKIVVPKKLQSDGTKRIMALCPDKYRTEDTYEYVDWGILTKDQEKKVPVYDY